MFCVLQIDLNRPIKEQGPFSVVLHKLTDVIAASDDGDEEVGTILKF